MLPLEILVLNLIQEIYITQLQEKTITTYIIRQIEIKSLAQDLLLTIA